MWVDWRRVVGRAGESLDRLASGCRSGWGVLVECGVDSLVRFCLVIAWVRQRRDVSLAIGWIQRRGSIGLGLQWLDTLWVSPSESFRTASVEIKLLAYEEERHG